MPGTHLCLQQSFENVLYYYPHFTDEKTETPRREAIRPRSHVQKVEKPGFEPVLSGFISHTLNHYSI